VFLAAGLLMLGYAGYIVVEANAYQAAERLRFERARADAVVASAGAVLVPAAAPDDGIAIGEILIPRLGLSAMVVQGESPAILRHAVGHLADTALPGEIGNVVLAGHRDTFFRPLKGVRAGDAITLRTLKGDHEYLVESTAVVAPTAVDVLDPTGGRTLTLITCFPFSYVGAAPNRFIVRAHETEGRSLSTSSRRNVTPSSAAATGAACCATLSPHR
jgi:sortase A